MKRIIILLAVGLIALSPLQGWAAKKEPITADKIFILVNQERIKAGIPELKRNATLDAAAAMKAKDQVDNKYFAHTSPKGIDTWHWFKTAGYVFHHAGENLSQNYIQSSRERGSFKTSEDVIKAWMNSPTHRANILDPKYTETGLAVNGKYEVEMFGTP